MKINKLLKNIESFPSDLISTTDLRKVGFLEKNEKMDHLSRHNLEYYRFGKCVRRFLKRDIIDLINKNATEFSPNDEYSFKDVFICNSKKDNDCGNESMLTNESFISMLSSIKKIVEKQGLYISELIKGISEI